MDQQTAAALHCDLLRQKGPGDRCCNGVVIPLPNYNRRDNSFGSRIEMWGRGALEGGGQGLQVYLHPGVLKRLAGGQPMLGIYHKQSRLINNISNMSCAGHSSTRATHKSQVGLLHMSYHPFGQLACSFARPV